jgi:DNA-binding winged helix-turn-helix (wHTH) protein
MPSTPTQTSIRFGTFDVDLQTQELRKQGVRLRLQAQSFLILKMLLEHPGKLVTREELRAALWPSDTFVDFDTGLNAAVKRLRETLGDSADSPHLIETLPRRGYRFIGPVDNRASADTTNASTVAASQDFGTRASGEAILWQRVLRYSVVLGVATLIASAAFFLYRGSGAKGMSPPAIKSLAVLPLKNFSSDPEQEYFADAMTDELIGELSRINSLGSHCRRSPENWASMGSSKVPFCAPATAYASRPSWFMRRQIGTYGANPTNAISEMS